MKAKRNYIKIAFILSLVTIFYNIAEGIISIYYGLTDETLTLFGFGVDSFIETLSAIGIFIMVLNMKKDIPEGDLKYEKQALKITGWCFYLLTIGLTTGAFFNIINNQIPTTTLPGVVISLISIIFMIYLVWAKKDIGKKLNSQAMITDANCNLVCIYMSVVVLVSSLLFELFHLPYIDAIGSLGLAYFSMKEGQEAFEHARTGRCSCGSH